MIIQNSKSSIGSKIKYNVDAVVDALKESCKKLAIRVSAEDFGVLDGESWIAADSVPELFVLASEWAEENCFEKWAFCGGDIMNDKGEIKGIANLNRNRISKLGTVGNDCYQTLPNVSDTIPSDHEYSPYDDWFTK